ncbi:MAG: ATP-binding cassette domain-containing protein, partial [Candidatus Rokubacteria bacterium]|nr:ATP-binding cassette domain-containing protein [Candidatus Rokubacteria bacterium]
MSLLSVEGVTAGYEQMEILHDVSIEVRSGEIVTLIGPNGAGKSTLMKTVFGLLTPRRGSIRLEGQDITGLAPSALVGRGLSYVPQVDNVFPSLTVEENLEMGAFTRKDPEAVRSDVKRLLDRFPIIGRRRDKEAMLLSGGERQVLSIARALMLHPD